jgi:hypothetical protein
MKIGRLLNSTTGIVVWKSSEVKNNWTGAKCEQLKGEAQVAPVQRRGALEAVANIVVGAGHGPSR